MGAAVRRVRAGVGEGRAARSRSLPVVSVLAEVSTVPVTGLWLTPPPVAVELASACRAAAGEW